MRPTCRELCFAAPPESPLPAKRMLETLIPKLASRTDLTPDECRSAALALADPGITDAVKEAFLVALADKGETASELAAFAETYRSLAKDPDVGEYASDAIDMVGTGGDQSGGFNISSVVVLVVASAGARVMKHGNRGVTSKCGSADLLAALGVDLEAPPEKSRAALRELGYCFFFAPAYHSAFKHVGPVRRALANKGKRTLFNFLGPLINPGRPAHTLLGVSSLELVDKLAAALETIGSRGGIAAHGVIAPGRGIDEITTATENHVRGFGRFASASREWQPERFGMKRAPFQHLLGGDVDANRATVHALVAGKAPQGLSDTIILNSAIALWICGKVPDVESGIVAARDVLLGGAVERKIAATREFYRSC